MDTDGNPVLADEAGDLLAGCHGALQSFLAERQEVLDLLEGLIATADDETARPAERQRHLLQEFEPSITLIGQVKAGKTSLVNAMVGAPGLLPADVNPWTSVVTSLHLRDGRAQPSAGAAFTFFEAEDWDRLTRKGGRIGELAGRSGAEEEAAKVQEQIAAMREKTKARLGRKFELLLGTSHRYGSYDKALIERYVCLGDDVDGQGQFADITKAADLEVPRPAWPLALCLRDTPGVNDTFMMREQITISAIRDSGICVVVLSAHQALTTVDMALIRLISNVRAREVVIFVNRIDELPEPATQIDEIRSSIRSTLRAQNGPHDAHILFGSAHWANAALTEMPLTTESEAVLRTYAGDAASETSPVDLAWACSGVPDLYAALWERVAEGPGRECLQTVARQAMNLANGLQALAKVDRTFSKPLGGKIDLPAIEREFSQVAQTVTEDFGRRFNSVLERAVVRMERSHKSFLERATAALIQHLETYGEYAPWTYDPTGLRVLLRSGYQVFARQARAAAEESGQAAIHGVAEVYGRLLDQDPNPRAIQSPIFPKLPAPVLLGQTIALDLKGTWWRRWWSRQRGYATFAEQFHKMIEAETQPIVTDLLETHCRQAEATWSIALAEFFADQKLILDSLEGGPRDLSDQSKSAELQTTLARLSRHAA